MRVRGKDRETKFIWHSCKYCKRAFRSKVEAVKHKREQHATEMRNAVSHSTIDSDDEPAIVTVTKFKDRSFNNSDHMGRSKLVRASSCSPNIEAQIPTLTKMNNPQNSQQLTHNNNSKHNSSPPVSHHVDKIRKIISTNDESQDSGHSATSCSPKQLLYAFLSEKNNNSYTCQSKNNNKSTQDFPQNKYTNRETQPPVQRRQKRRQLDSNETLPISSTSPRKKVCVTTMDNDKNGQFSTKNSKVKSGTSQSSCKVLRRLLSSDWESSKLKQCQPTKSAQSLSCLICRVPFFDKGSLAQHLDSHLQSPKIPDFQCQICTKSFEKRENLEAHTESSACRTDFTCSFCFLHFPNLYQLKLHEEAHGGRTPYSCKFCLLPFETVGSLMAHLVRHTTDSETV